MFDWDCPYEKESSELNLCNEVRTFEYIHFDATDVCFHLRAGTVLKRPIPQLLQLIKVSDNWRTAYEELLQINKDISIHQKHLRILALEVKKSIIQFNPEFMWHCFDTNLIPYNPRKGTRLLMPPTKSVNFGTNSVTFRGSFSWNNLSLRLKISQTIDDFKSEPKNLGKIHCTCTVCR